VLQQVRPRPVQHSGAAAGDAGRVAAGLDAVAASLEAVQAYPGVGDERVEDADRVGAATHARGDGVGQATGHIEALLPRLDADPANEVAHHHRERVRTCRGAQQVVGGVDVGDPVAQRLVDGVLEGT